MDEDGLSVDEIASMEVCARDGEKARTQRSEVATLHCPSARAASASASSSSLNTDSNGRCARGFLLLMVCCTPVALAHQAQPLGGRPDTRCAPSASMRLISAGRFSMLVSNCPQR